MAHVEGVRAALIAAICDCIQPSDERTIMPLVNAITDLIDAVVDARTEATEHITSLRRAGPALVDVVHAFERQDTWTVKALIAEISAPRKQVYNALGFLTRTGRVQRMAYGRYRVKRRNTPLSEQLQSEQAQQELARRELASDANFRGSE